MKPTLASAAALATFALLAGCSPKGGGTTTASGAAAAGAPASGPDVQVDLANMPHQRAGLWKTVLDDGDGKPDVSTTCMSGETPAVPKMPATCKQFTIKRTFLGAYVMDMDCATADYSMTAHAVVTGDVQTHLTGDSTITMSINHAPTQTIKSHTDATWIGPCAPGQKPDDDSSAQG
ncbi:DUF3617 domain-containing protein [Phenylobacterium sp.]|uniref:DUF3617 domain-containing protein n=1 Tax=Phenylobacterium sp. TaxID=1871053 RepID=UPI002F41E4BB